MCEAVRAKTSISCHSPAPVNYLISYARLGYGLGFSLVCCISFAAAQYPAVMAILIASFVAVLVSMHLGLITDCVQHNIEQSICVRAPDDLQMC